MTEAPEFHTKTLSPLSPVPVHPPEPSNIAVLRNQTDPVFNMTSTHIDPPQPAVVAPADSNFDPIASANPPDSPADSSFSDAYKEETNGEDGKQDGMVNQDTVSDDYAMTFDTDGEEHSDSQELSQRSGEQESKPLPVSVSVSSTVSPDVPIDTPQLGPDAGAPQSHSIPTHMPAVDATAPNSSENTAAQTRIETTKPTVPIYEEISNGEIDIQQLLDNITANAEKNEAASALNTPPSANPSNVSLPKVGTGLPAHASLPPRPQLPRPNYHDDISKYHAGAASFSQPHNTYKPPPGVNVPLVAAGAPGTYTDPRNGLPPPPTVSFRQPPPSTGSPVSPGAYPQTSRLPGQDGSTRSDLSGDVSDADARWGPEIQKLYDEFLAEERTYVTEGQWDRFPVGSRLFIGNLPSDKVTKRDIFHVFYKYGRLAQVAIKQAYGFVQFHDSAACYTALAREQGAEVRGRRMHLEISKPQKNTRNAQSTAAGRSRSPDYTRGGTGGNRQGQPGRGHDRYDSRSNAPVRDEDGRILRGRDDYRPGRSPSPVRGNFRGRDDYGIRGGRDSYDGRDRRRSRSRSRSPYSQRDNRYRERPSNGRRREASEDAELQIPRREPPNVPDVQIILMDQLDRGFVNWVEGELAARGLKVEIMFLSSRLPLETVIRRQILEGVHAVSQLDMRAQNSSKISLQVFDRQGTDNVRFDEYQDLEPKIAAELVLRAKNASASAQAQPTYDSGFVTGQAYQPPPAQPAAPNLANLVGQLDNTTLQKLLSSMSAPQQQTAPVAMATNPAVDLAGLLGGLKAQQPQQPQQTYPPTPDPYASLAGNPALSSLLGNGVSQQQQAQPQQSAQQVQNIMAQLARFRQ